MKYDIKDTKGIALNKLIIAIIVFSIILFVLIVLLIIMKIGENSKAPIINFEIIHQDIVPSIGENIESINSENIPIPKGFYPVEGTNKKTGFVISSIESDDLNNSKGGNQFVWIPVNQNQKIHLSVDSSKEIKEIKLYDPFGKELLVESGTGKKYSNDNIIPTNNGQYKVEINTSNGTETQRFTIRSLYAKDRFNDFLYSDEYAKTQGFTSITEMINSLGFESIEELASHENADFEKFADSEDYTESVNANGGFYIGRFEAGTTKPLSTGDLNVDINTLEIPLSRIGVDTYNNVTRSQAKELAEKMYSGKSHLLTGAGWDRTLGWIIEENDKKVTTKDIVVDSSKWGNFSESSFRVGTGNLAKTGGFENNTKVKNIYDLAGNVFEWTSEFCSTPNHPCVFRGGSFDHSVSYGSASMRDDLTESAFGTSAGFRVALFL